jgi:two-component system OmpR family response regulator
MRILFIGCRHPYSAWLFNALVESGHSLQRAEDVPDSILLAAQEVFDAVVATALDSRTQGMLVAALTTLASAAGQAAIVTIVRESTPAERVRMLYAGAAACFCLQLSFIELHERLHALHRASQARLVQSRVAQPGLKLCLLSNELIAGDERVAVTRREYLLLECLIRHFDVPVARNQLSRYAWPGAEDADASNVNLVVTRLRRKLELRLPWVQIETIKRYGYRLVVSEECPLATGLRQTVDAWAATPIDRALPFQLCSKLDTAADFSSDWSTAQL